MAGNVVKYSRVSIYFMAIGENASKITLFQY